MFTIKSYIIILSSILSINAYQVLNLKNPTTKYGFVYPNRAEPNSNVTYVIEGVDVLIYLAKVPENYADCRITTQDAEITFTLIPNSDPNDKVAFWTPDSKNTGCGARIKNVKVSDSGRWRLQATNEEEDHFYQSFINLKVIQNFDRPDGNFTIREGPSDEVNITKYASYCQIAEPVLFGDQNIFEKCQVELENINKLYSGKWKANVGVLGKIDEIVLQPRVEVLGESFDVGSNKTGSKINLFCNLKNAVDVNITFCRFIKDGSEFGLRLSEGLSNGDYSYFGRQLKDGDCGVTIENPKSTDYVTWKCSVGIHRLVNLTIEYEVKEAIISLKNSKSRSKRDIERESQTIETLPDVLAGVETPLELHYKADFQIKYCIVKHPNGTQYAINGEFRNFNWTTTGNINIGVCGMTIFNTSLNDAGMWEMQIGHYDTHIMDKIVHIPVRVGEKAMIAIDKTLIATNDSPLTIKCKAVSAVFKKPNIIEYCRFTLPDGTGFQIDQRVTEDEAIQGLYWYNGTSLDKGDCQVTIKKVDSKHYGQWYCSGKIKDSKHLEDYDSIDVDSGPLSIASISGIAVGAAVLVIGTGGGFVYYRKKKHQQPQRRQTFLSSSSRSSHSETVFERNEPLVTVEERQPEIIEEIEMGTISQSHSRTSQHSRPSTSVHSVISAMSEPSAESRTSASTQRPTTSGERTDL